MAIIVEVPGLVGLTEKMSAASTTAAAEIKAALLKATIAIQVLAREEAPKKTGALRNSILYTVKDFTGEVSTKKQYARYVEFGTGLYGPKKQMIVPVNAKVLATKINPGWGTANKAGYYIIGKTSKGQHPNQFMHRAADQAPVAIIKPIFKAMMDSITKEIK